ncbi:MAG: hypothetical protein AAF563_04695 [Pseudomonadota bacterium]
MEKDKAALRTVEKAIASSGDDFRKLRESAEQLYDGAVRVIAEREGCDMRRAHYLASKDPVAKQAYAKVVELQEREQTARAGASRLAAYIS